ncbi:hypothetical protein HMPREF9073_02860 [Capnocytophaga sp. oral taxon 326 str. F0382]|nr:hypothetical protein HMPREF9073_02860 [Capnocytophaga sp. oral taxon 326 str. F0382]
MTALIINRFLVYCRGEWQFALYRNSKTKTNIIHYEKTYTFAPIPISLASTSIGGENPNMSIIRYIGITSFEGAYNNVK